MKQPTPPTTSAQQQAINQLIKRMAAQAVKNHVKQTQKDKAA